MSHEELISALPVMGSAVVNIKFNGTEHRVPGPGRTEEEAYYTDDREDAIDTAKCMWRHVNSLIIRINNQEI